MGTLRGDNGGERPPEGGGLPGLPPEWGTVVIPDDAAALRHEAELVRKQMRRQARRNWWRRRFGLPPLTHRSPQDDAPALGLPLLIMSIAIIATLTSLFAIAWPSRSVQTAVLPVTAASSASTASGGAGGASAATRLPEVPLTQAGGAPLLLYGTLPAVILLVDGCASCTDLIRATAEAVDPTVTVLAVGRTAAALPSPLPANRKIRAAADPAGALRSQYGLPGHTGVVAVLVRKTGDLVTVVRDVDSVDAVRAYLSQLG